MHRTVFAALSPTGRAALLLFSRALGSPQAEALPPVRGLRASHVLLTAGKPGCPLGQPVPLRTEPLGRPRPAAGAIPERKHSSAESRPFLKSSRRGKRRPRPLVRVRLSLVGPGNVSQLYHRDNGSTPRYRHRFPAGLPAGRRALQRGGGEGAEPRRPRAVGERRCPPGPAGGKRPDPPPPRRGHAPVVSGGFFGPHLTAGCTTATRCAPGPRASGEGPSSSSSSASSSSSSSSSSSPPAPATSFHRPPPPARGGSPLPGGL